VLFHLLARIETEVEILHLLCANTTVNMNKVEIKVLQGSAVTENV